ncbi:translation initiation factor IF-2 N-terminal domain-containing protein [Corynebacterium sp. MSK008]|uniref:translation initiation factor IF-2 N-terminal domain-containing protein n=1 Tax=Corynebacterium sp. MSK008 TaxID=3050188 RepID=UPI00254FAEE9|nr:translation initiation factor IF-2 N-terminal domain-containing protein [Corynebacterium sp. MSK008]MDK8879973.1 translation initiation factor IF-2 N-terminal domain-containing protein [Corynebacterium sp. MSK008]
MAGHKNIYAEFDRSQLAEKTRVFTLAKALGVPSKELVVALSELGVVKVAQSTLTRAESEQLLDALANSAEAAESADTDESADAADEKIRQRVRKDVENEIHQIEEKVEADLREGPLTDVEPEVTPVPEETNNRAPVFKAPERKRRRATRQAAPSEEKESKPIDEASPEDADKQEPEVIEEPKAIKGSSRLEAQRRRRTEKREEQRKRSRIVSQAEFLARRESVERHMVVRERDRHDGHGKITQVGVLEDGLLVEHFVTAESQSSMIGNIYLGRVQNVLSSMEAAFIDIGQGRNGVLYASEVDWKAAGLGGRSRRIEQALKSGDQVLVQVTKDPVGHKGARLTTQISLAGRYLVYVPGGRSAGISRKLPAPERKRLKEILNNVVPGKGGAIIRTAAENVPEEAIAADVNRLHNQWTAIQNQAEKEKASKGAKPVTLYEEPNILVKVVRDLFNEDFTSLIVDGRKPWNTVHAYVQSVAPDLLDRLEKFDRSAHDGKDAFEVHRIDEQLQKALSRTVWLPSGGTLVIDRTEAMTVIDVNTGKFTGSGGSLEETVTSNNLEAAEEIVRQIRLRDIGGMIIVDFIDMILPENQELVLRRLNEALGRDRTRHQVSEVTSLGLVQMTRKRLGNGLLETFSTECECCGGRGIIVTDDPVEHDPYSERGRDERSKRRSRDDEHRSSRGRNKPAAAEHDTERDSERGEQPPRGSRRSKRKHLNEDEMDNLLNSIFSDDSDGGDSEDAAGDDNSDNDASEGRRRSSRRRGRRGGNRGRGPQTDAQDKQEERPEKDKSPEGDKDAPEQSFEEAVEEFDKSPRRKRRTRGNSRSDVRPRREDYQDVEKAEPADKAEPAEKKKPAAKAKPAAGRRGRRRAVRKSNATSAAAANARAAQKERPKKEERQAERRREAKASPRRGRRRATRRSS